MATVVTSSQEKFRAAGLDMLETSGYKLSKAQLGGRAPGEKGIPDKGVSSSLRADGGHGAMPRDETQVVTQGKDPLADGVYEVLMITAGKVGAPDGPLEDDITNLCQAVGRGMENHMTRGVARAVYGFQPNGAKFDQIPIAQPLIRGEGRDWGEAKAGALAGQGLQ